MIWNVCKIWIIYTYKKNLQEQCVKMSSVLTTIESIIEFVHNKMAYKVWYGWVKRFCARFTSKSSIYEYKDTDIEWSAGIRVAFAIVILWNINNFEWVLTLMTNNDLSIFYQISLKLQHKEHPFCCKKKTIQTAVWFI